MTGLKFHNTRSLSTRAVTTSLLGNPTQHRELLAVQPVLKSRLCPSSGGKTVPSRPETAKLSLLPLQNLGAWLTASCSEAVVDGFPALGSRGGRPQPCLAGSGEGESHPQSVFTDSAAAWLRDTRSGIGGASSANDVTFRRMQPSSFPSNHEKRLQQPRCARRCPPEIPAGEPAVPSDLPHGSGEMQPSPGSPRTTGLSPWRNRSLAD